MSRRSLLTESERTTLLAFPDTLEGCIHHYSFSEADFSAISQRRGAHNRLGFAIQLCYLRYPGITLPTDAVPPNMMLTVVCRQLQVEPEHWHSYGQREETRREHQMELQALLGLTPFSLKHFRHFVHQLADIAQKTDKGILLAEHLVDSIRQQKIILPAVDVIERVCAEALTLGTRQLYKRLIKSLAPYQREALDKVLQNRESSSVSMLIWLRQPAGVTNPKHILEHIERLKYIQKLNLPAGLEQSVHQNRLLKLAREGAQMTSQHLRDLEDERRYATVVAVLIETRATLVDEIIDLHDRFMGSLFNKAKRSHAERFQQSANDINHKVALLSKIGHVLVETRESGANVFEAIEAIIPWEQFCQSITDADSLSQPSKFDFLALLPNYFSQLRSYVPELLENLKMAAAPTAAEILEAVNVLKTMNERQARKVPDDAPTAFIRKRWHDLVHTDSGIDRRFYELATLAELKNSLRSGDIWVQDSRQFKNFEEYLLPVNRYTQQRSENQLGLSIHSDCEQHLKQRMYLLTERLNTVEKLAKSDELPDASITESGRLEITPLTNAVPDEAADLQQKVYSLLPRIKITELLLEVDEWTGFSTRFKHLKTDALANDRQLLLTAILSDAINLGLSKMAASCPGTTYAKLTWLQAWHIRDETYNSALSELTNAQHRHPFSSYWGNGTTSSSDGQNLRAGGRGQAAGQVNMKYGPEPGVQLYTHISDQFSPFYKNLISPTIRDSTYVLDGLLYHESDLRIEEHYTDTAGFTDHVFALMHMLGFRFAPRIRDLADKRFYIPAGSSDNYPTLANLIGGQINTKIISTHWDEVLRLASSIRQGTVTASLMLRKLGSYPRQNGLAVALRELGRIERTLFALDWIQSIDLRRRVQIGLNKGEAKNALARAVFLNQLGEMRDRTLDNQRNRASGLNLVVSAIILWNTVYLERVVKALRESGYKVNEELIQHISPLGWEHINLTGDYIWPQSHEQLAKGQFRPLRKVENP